MVVKDESGTAERIASRSGRVDFARVAEERDVDLVFSLDRLRPEDDLFDDEGGRFALPLSLLPE